MINRRFSKIHHVIAYVCLTCAVGMPAAVAADVAEESPVGPRETTNTLRLKGGLPETIPIPGDIRPYAKSPYATQIDKALAFLAFKDRDSNRQYRLVLLDYMQRKYGLHERYSIQATRAPHLLDDQRDDLGNIKRLIEPDFKVERSVIKNAPPLERVALQALYCDVYPVEISLLDEMNEMIQKGMSPFLPTLGIAYLWLRDHGCFAGEPKLMLVRDALAVKFRNHLRDDGLNAYMAGQALALLFEVGHGEMVQEDWLATVANAQREDGSWDLATAVNDAGKGNGMTTAHVLWALLEHAQPDAPDTPLIRERDAGVAAE